MRDTFDSVENAAADDRRVRRLRLFGACGLATVLGAALGGGLVLWLNGSSADRVVARWRQPSTIHYQSFDPYTLAIVESGTFRTLISTRSSHEVRVFRGDDPSGYGHVIDLSFDFLDSEVDEAIRRSRVTWTDQGVWLETPTLHRFFIPKSAFVGGR